MIATKEAIYLITNVFYAYILCKFMRVFFGQKGKNIKIEVGAFFVYYCVNSIVYLGFQKTAITVCSNLICYFLLTYNYNSGIKLKAISVFFIYAILSSSETITLLLLRIVGMNHFSEFSALEFLTAQILSNILSLIFSLIFSS